MSRADQPPAAPPDPTPLGILRQRHPRLLAETTGYLSPGWFDIVARLCADVEGMVPPRQHRRVSCVQIKEKFGALRFYLNVLPPRVDFIVPRGFATALRPISPRSLRGRLHERIRSAETESATTCEICGRPGTSGDHQRSGWIRTLCDDHAHLDSLALHRAYDAAVARIVAAHTGGQGPASPDVRRRKKTS